MQVLVYDVAPAKVAALLTEWEKQRRAHIITVHLGDECSKLDLSTHPDIQFVRYARKSDVDCQYIHTHNIRVVWCSNPSLLPWDASKVKSMSVRHSKSCIHATISEAARSEMGGANKRSIETVGSVAASNSVPLGLIVPELWQSHKNTVRLCETLALERFMFVSLGAWCQTEHNLNKYVRPRTNTYFFEWQESCFESVLAVLTSNYDEVFTLDNIVPNTEERRWIGDLHIHMRSLKQLGLHLRFFHDFRLDEYFGNEQRVHREFLEKYRRRHSRLRQLIHDSAHSSSEIVFVRCEKQLSSLREEQYTRFRDAILAIHPGAKYRLVVITIYPNDVTMPPRVQDTHIHLHLGPNYMLPEEKLDCLDPDVCNPIRHWTLPRYDWETVYRDVISLLQAG